MSRKWPKLLFQPLRPPGASGGVNIENKSVQPVYIHTITPYFGQKSGFWMHLRGYLIGTTLPGHCVWQCLIWAIFVIQTSHGCLKVSEFYQESDYEDKNHLRQFLKSKKQTFMFL